MFPRGHAGLAMIIYAIITSLTQVTSSYIVAIGLFIIVLTSILPDFDIIEASVLNRIEHRGITHTIWFSIVSFIITYGFFMSLSIFFAIQHTEILYLATVALIGYTSHLFGDALNESGIRPFYIPNYQITEWRIGFNLLRSQSNKVNNIFHISGIFFYLLSLVARRFDYMTIFVV